MPYRKVGELATVDLRFDGEEPDSTAYDLYPGRPMAPQESVASPPPPAQARPRRAARPPPTESPIEGLDDESPPPGNSGVSHEEPIDFGSAPHAAPGAQGASRDGSEGSNLIPIAVVVILAGVGGYLIYRSMNKNRF